MVMSLPKLLCICCFAGIVLPAPAPPNCFKREILEFHKDIDTTCNESKNLPCWNDSVRDINFIENCSQMQFQNAFRQIKANLNQTTCKTIFSKTVIAPLLLGNTSVPHSVSRPSATTLNVFCTEVKKYAEYLYSECSDQLRNLCKTK